MKENRKAYASLCTAMLIFGTIAVFRRNIPLSSGLLAFSRGLLGARERDRREKAPAEHGGIKIWGRGFLLEGTHPPLSFRGKKTGGCPSQRKASEEKNGGEKLLGSSFFAENPPAPNFL